MIRLIKNGRVIDPASNTDQVCDLWIDEDGNISDQPTMTVDQLTDDQVIDARDNWVMPGLVDLAVRFREPGEEHKGTIQSESAASLAGGITTVCLEPDTVPVIDTPAVMELIQQRAQYCPSPHISLLGAMTSGLQSKQLSEMGALRDAGCVGISNAGKPLADSQLMRNVLDYAVSYDLKAFISPVDKQLTIGGCAHEGKVATRMGLPGIPDAAETAVVARDLTLIEATGIRAHFCRISSAGSVDMITQAQQRGLAVTADVAAHQLFLTENDIMDFNSNAHVRPPLRTERDRDALRQAVASGVVSSICSDHQPHEADAKLAPFAETEPGISGLETLLALCMKLVQENALDLSTALRSLTCNPAGILGVSAGSLAAGNVADVIIYDPDSEWTLDRQKLLSRGKNTPFHNWPFRGMVCYTLLKGQPVYSCH